MRVRRVALAGALMTLTVVDASAFGFDPLPTLKQGRPR
jgi:hypothetical protein